MGGMQLSTLAKCFIGTGIVALLAPLSFLIDGGEVQWLLLDRPVWVAVSYLVALMCAVGTMHEVLRNSSRL